MFYFLQTWFLCFSMGLVCKLLLVGLFLFAMCAFFFVAPNPVVEIVPARGFISTRYQDFLCLTIVWQAILFSAPNLAVAYAYSGSAEPSSKGTLLQMKSIICL
jgi:hypothetical protein